MKMPSNLNPEEKRFWQRHAKRCESEGTLTEESVDSFLLLCKTWSLLQAIDFGDDDKLSIMKFIGLSKAFERQGIAFGITSKKKIEKKQDLKQLLNEVLCPDE